MDSIPVENNNPVGQPTKYKVAYNREVYKLCLLGATDSDIADFFDIAESTLNNWKNIYPKFYASMQRGKKKADAKVAESLFKQAIGYEVTETTFEKVDGKEALIATPDGDIVADDTYRKRVVKKQQPPSTPASIFWLKNRDKKNWRDKHEIESTNTNRTTIIDWSDEGDDGNNNTPTSGSESDSSISETA